MLKRENLSIILLLFPVPTSLLIFLKKSKFFNEAQKTDGPSASSLSRKDSNEVNEIYDKKGITEASEIQILKLLKPTARGLAQRYRDRPNYNEQ